MRRVVRAILLFFVFTIPWEYSLDLGPPLGNIARLAGLLLFAVSVLALAQDGQVRMPGLLQWLTLAFYLWFCCTLFWTVVPDGTVLKLRGYFQEMMIVWILWEFIDRPRDLRRLLQAWLAGTWVLAILTIANFAVFDPGSLEPGSGDQIRFAAYGQDPNDVARYLDLGFPVAALLLEGSGRWPGKLLAAGFLPLGFACVLLTASRGGFVAAVIALIGCVAVLARRYRRSVLVGAPALAVAGAIVWFSAPAETLGRIGSIVDQIRGGDLNQRVNIWWAGWNAFVKAPLVGHGAGSFVAAARLSPIDTAHNTALSILVEGGLCALILAACIVAFSLRSVFEAQGTFRIALATLIAVWLTSSLVGTVSESRTTWLLLAVIALGNRMTRERPGELEREFGSNGLAGSSALSELEGASRS